MPIFEYSCQSCGHQFEFLQIPSAPAAACPQCHGQSLERLLSGFAFGSLELTKARVRAARKQMRESKDYKDKQVADIEELKHHQDH